MKTIFAILLFVILLTLLVHSVSEALFGISPVAGLIDQTGLILAAIATGAGLFVADARQKAKRDAKRHE